jgi:hypothetical protein
MKQQQIINKTAVENFLVTIDVTMLIEDHFRNAYHDAHSYDWNSATLGEIFTGIEEAYKNKGE